MGCSHKSHGVATLMKACSYACRAAAQVRVHMSSVNAGLFAPPSPPRRQQAPRPCPLMIFEEVTRNESQLTVRQCTAVNAHVRPHAGMRTGGPLSLLFPERAACQCQCARAPTCWHASRGPAFTPVPRVRGLCTAVNAHVPPHGGMRFGPCAVLVPQVLGGAVRCCFPEYSTQFSGGLQRLLLLISTPSLCDLACSMLQTMRRLLFAPHLSKPFLLLPVAASIRLCRRLRATE